jgi:glycosyltransferase involved in cell wall biosynthesis
MKIVLAYLIPIDDWASYGMSARKFADTYRLFPPGVEHQLLVVCCNGPVTEQVKMLFQGSPATFSIYRGGGWDCGAAQHTAQTVDCDFLVIANARVYFQRAGWLRRLAEARVEYGEGLFGASASYETLPFVPGELNPHIRTSFYGYNPKIFRQYPHRIDSREKCYKFESGAWNFTRWFQERGDPCRMVTWDGCYEKQDFRKPPNVFRKGDQSNLIICDGQTDMYAQANPQRRVELETFANGGLASVFSLLDAPSRLTPARSEPAHAPPDGFQRGAAMQPLVSIGMPIYDAEEYLALALESLLAQDYPHFELIVSDNHSADRTEEICRQFAARDSRIRYIRQPQNQDMPWNFARVVHEAKGEYFMWAAHDDLFHPSYIRKCLEQLAAHREAICCCTEINFINARGLPHSDWSNKKYSNLETLGMTPPQRIHELISLAGWFATYGLMRLESAKKMSLGLGVWGFDVVLIEELLLLGDFVKVHEPLFSYRMAKSKSVEDYQLAFNSEGNPLAAPKTPYADLAAHLLQTVYRSQLPSEQKLEIFADFLVTLSAANNWWRAEITSELIGRGASLRDLEFAVLLAVVLSRSVPLDTMNGNPLIRAMYLPEADGKDLLQIAESLCTRAGIPLPLNGPYQKAVQHFCERRFEEASASFAQALRQRETGEIWCDWATVRLFCNDLAGAERGFRRALDLDAGNDLAALKLGVLLIRLERHADAVRYLEQCVSRQSEPQRTEVLQMLATCRSKLAVIVTS